MLSETERAFLFKNQRFQKIISQESIRLWFFHKKCQIQTFDVMDFQGIPMTQKLQMLLTLYPDEFNAHLISLTTTENEIALIYQNGQLQNMIGQSKQVLFWKAIPDLEIKKYNTVEHPFLPYAVDQAIRKTESPILKAAGLKTKTLTLGQDKLAFVFKEEQLIQVLNTGLYRFWDQSNTLNLEIIDIANPLMIGYNPRLLSLVDTYPTLFQDFILEWTTASNEVGLVYEKHILKDIISPSKRGVYWQNQALNMTKITFEEGQEIEPKLARALRQPRDLLLQEAVKNTVFAVDISDQHIGFLMRDDTIQQALTKGHYAWWTFNHKMAVKQIDLRLQTMDISGQEILTKDRVSLRINLFATWQVVDAAKVIEMLTDHIDYLYRELQLALRTVVSTKTLDELLEDKNLLNQDVLNIASKKIMSFGIALKSTGVKDVILPGEMKDILAKVVEAQKIAEANLIKRREETQATRSLHNTAKVMENNPTLLRLKELEVLEKITSKISNLNVYGGLDGVLNDLVKLRN